MSADSRSAIRRARRARALDERRQTVASERAQRGVDGHGARPPRFLRHELVRIALRRRCRRCRRPSSVIARRCDVGCAQNDEAAVVRARSATCARRWRSSRRARCRRRAAAATGSRAPRTRTRRRRAATRRARARRRRSRRSDRTRRCSRCRPARRRCTARGRRASAAASGVGAHAALLVGRDTRAARSAPRPSMRSAAKIV